MRSCPGFVATRLHRAVSPNPRFRSVNVAEWETPQDPREAVTSPEFRATAAGTPPNYPALYGVVRPPARTRDDRKEKRDEREHEMSVWAIISLIAGGLFAGGAAAIAWSRVPIWRRMPAEGFIGDFRETLRRTDQVQPALLVVAIVSSAGFALTADGSARVLASVGAVGFVASLAASLAILVPLQRRIVATPPAEAEAIDEMRARWFRGNLGRSMLGVASLVAVAVAATL